MDTTTDDVAERPGRVIHDMLVSRHSDAYEAWTRQDAIVTAIRADLGAGSGDDADRGAGRAQLDEQEAVAVALRGHLDALAIAVERSEVGTYGTCVTCDGPIAAERLELFPAATQCIGCREHAERH